MKEEVEYNDLAKYVENNTVSNNSYLSLHIKDAADKLCEGINLSFYVSCLELLCCVAFVDFHYLSSK